MPVDRISAPLLHWYDRNARTLPWRALPGSNAPTDIYGIWLSEIMAQQTNVAAAAPYWRHFRARWPTVEALATADDAEVMAAWAGLGYYARARNLLATARAVANLGGFPQTEQGLRALPGIGAYTAAAIAAIALGERTLPVDANIERVGSRLFARATAVPALRGEIATLLGPHVPAARAGDFAQALMDLGAAICTPRNPQCPRCPLAEACMAYAAGTPDAFPVRAAKKERPVRHGTAWWIEQGEHVALVRRPPKGLLGGMLALPGTGWGVETATTPPFPARWHGLASPVVHVFTHFELRLSIARTRLADRAAADAAFPQPLIWAGRDALSGLPTLYKRAAQAALAPELDFA